MSEAPEEITITTASWQALYRRVDEEPEPNTLIVYGQRDPRWATAEYAPGATFAAWGCLVCCVSMLVSLAYAERIEPPEVAENLRKNGCFSGGLLSYPARVNLAYGRLFWNGVVHYRNKPADMGTIARAIADNGAVIAEVAFNPAYPVYWEDADGAPHWNQHFVLITRIDSDDVEIADPWDGKLVMLTKSRFYKSGWPKQASRIITGLRLFDVVA